MLKIGFLDRCNASWTAGASYTRSMVHALASAAPGRCAVHVMSGRSSALAELPPGTQAIRLDSDRPTAKDIREAVAEYALDVLLPVTEALLPDTQCALVGWIPDFQHRHLTAYFTEEQRGERDHYFKYLIENCDAMMFSSEAVRSDFRNLYPEFSGLSGCAPFPSFFAYDKECVAKDPGYVVGKYHLPEAFVLVANQFWKHKNHRLVLQAVAEARLREPRAHVVMVGMLSDSRDIANTHLSELIRQLSTEKLFENISVLGEVPREDLVSLMRCAVEVIQPSEFEGWNTTVEDALALGKQVACSDIETHREQARDAFFFAVDDAAALAGHLASLDWSRGGWRGNAGEMESLERERNRGREWAGGLIGFCETVKARYQANVPVRTGWIHQMDDLKRNPVAYVEYLETQEQRRAKIISAMQEREADLKKRLQELRVKATEERRSLEEQLSAARAAQREASEQYNREKAKPFRAKVREEFSKLLGGSKKGAS